jgi:16S rRNA (adenine1518-N6/adenine1519-N6)-dimethyltransferase
MKKPKLGQNFLVDDHARQRIADALGDVRERTVVEIGPGHGAITEILAGRAKRLIAVELDRGLAAELRFKYRDQPQVAVVEADILGTDIGQFASAGGSVEVVGNLPYYITSDILLHLFGAAVNGTVGRAVLMMQREVAQRVAAGPGVREYGLLSATTQMYAEAEELFTLGPEAFNPPPDVYSTVIRLHFRPRFEELGVDAVGFDQFLRKSFAQKRKTLANNLRNGGYPAEAIAAGWPEGLEAQVRAEQVSLKAMAELYRGLLGP